MLLFEVTIQRCRGTTSRHERSAAVLAGHLPGGWVVGCFGKVEPSFASGLAASGVSAGRDGQNVGGRSARAGCRESRWRRSVVEAACNVSGALGICSLHRGAISGKAEWM